ncbi:HEAT repeat domain-containing protein [Pedobacter polaris]|uniref:HEAT repeat domain-containing protein n=1 Tax=Pedobacter polaris TaxID=2571273 RepID=A0A4U1CGC7_9SPHI|nr:HEAT repeat domain-containing protein [Pedobacter polaris]TKC05531.1 HEAT repeat domain-containing protein [Pedobacter polaris]
MAFYDLTKAERLNLVEDIKTNIRQELEQNLLNQIIQYFSSEDTYIRKSAYLSCGRLYFSDDSLKTKIIATLKTLLQHNDFKIRQTVINAAGEIGKNDFETVKSFFDEGLFDKHHSPRNAVIGCIKKMGEVNPTSVLDWARQYLHHSDKEVRREICHGIELRGRKYPQDILPLLKELQYDKTARVRNTLVHVIGQIAYKKGCLATVISSLKNWENKKLVSQALEEIIDVHFRYRDFSALTQEQAKQYIDNHYI